jgi:DNA-binding LytR/AlgR family response regulator
MNCIVIDDDHISRMILINYINKIDNLNLLADFDCPLKGLDFIESNKVHLVFLDYEMPNLNGIQVAKILKQTATQIIFTTAFEAHALKAYEYNVSGYLLKPISYDTFLEAIQKVQHKAVAESDSKIGSQMFIKVNKSLVKITYSDINYVEGNGDYINIVTSSTRYTLHASLKYAMNVLPKSDFIQIHRSYIIRIGAINKVDDETAEVSGKSIPIGKNYKKDFFSKIQLF